MRAAGRPGRGERGRVAERVRALLTGPPADGSAAARTHPVAASAGAPPVAPPDGPDGPDGPDDAPDARERAGWLPGSDFDRQLSRRAGAALRSSGWRSSGWRPAGWRRAAGERVAAWRWDPGRGGAAALGIAVVVVVAVTAWWLAANRPQAVPVAGVSSVAASTALTATAAYGASTAPLPTTSGSAPAGSSSSPPAPAATSPGGSSGVLVVDVAGKVRRPGVYRLPAGSRVYQAIQAAGGARPGVSTVALNLAAPLLDGQQIVVGAPATAPAPAVGGTSAVPTGAGSGSGSGGPATVVDLNSATLEQLEGLPGVGPVLGQHILDWRDAHGHFASVDQLQDVSGIGPARMADLRPLVTV